MNLDQLQKSGDFIIKIGNDFDIIKFSSLPIMDRYSTGSSICKGNLSTIFEKISLVDGSLVENVSTIEEVETVDIDLNNIDEQILTIDDFLDDFNV